MKRSTAARRTFPQPPARAALPSSVRSPMPLRVNSRIRQTFFQLSASRPMAPTGDTTGTRTLTRSSSCGIESGIAQGLVQRSPEDPRRRSPLHFVVSVHRRELGDLNVSPTGDYDFLTALRASTAATEARK